MKLPSIKKIVFECLKARIYFPSYFIFEFFISFLSNPLYFTPSKYLHHLTIHPFLRTMSILISMKNNNDNDKQVIFNSNPF